MKSALELGLVPLIAIGISAGGPGTLVHVLKKLPKDLTCAVVVLQHFNGDMSENLRSWLSESTPQPLRMALQGEYLTPGAIYLSPSDGDLELTGAGACKHIIGDFSSPYTPSIDRFFDSISKYRAPILAILMTGMGEDGAQGLLSIRKSGKLTIAQDDASSVINGMPRAAVRCGAAQRVLGIEQIITAITNFNLYPSRGRHE